jgi:hypothetical protein
MTTTRIPRNRDQQTIERLLTEAVRHFGEGEFNTVVTALATQLGFPHISLPDATGSALAIEVRIREAAIMIASAMEANEAGPQAGHEDKSKL